MAQRDCQHLVGRGHLKIERQARRRLDALEIVVADVAAVFAQVHGNAVATRLRDDFGGARRIGMLAAACIADRRDVINVHAEAQAAGVENVHAVFPSIRFRRGCRA